MPYRTRQTSKLTTGRESIPGSWYFLTWCTAGRRPDLTHPVTRSVALQAIQSLQDSGDGQVLAATIMPDHIHLLLVLGSRLTVSQVVSKTKSAIKRARPAIEWQINFFEVRLRDRTKAEAYAHYIFMNPYCAGLCRMDENWAGWIAGREVRWTFEDKLRDGALPQPEWLVEASRFSETLPAGSA